MSCNMLLYSQVYSPNGSTSLCGGSCSPSASSYGLKNSAYVCVCDYLLDETVFTKDETTTSCRNCVSVSGLAFGDPYICGYQLTLIVPGVRRDVIGRVTSRRYPRSYMRQSQMV